MEEYAKSRLDYDKVIQSLRRKHQGGQVWCMDVASLLDEVFCCRSPTPIYEDIVEDAQQNESFLTDDRQCLNVRKRDEVDESSISTDEYSLGQHRNDKSSLRSSDPTLEMKREENHTYDVQLALPEIYSTSKSKDVYDYQTPSRHIMRMDSFQCIASCESTISRHGSLRRTRKEPKSPISVCEQLADSIIPDGYSIHSFAPAEYTIHRTKKRCSAMKRRFVASPGRKHFNEDVSAPLSPLRKVESSAIPDLPYLTLTEGYEC